MTNEVINGLLEEYRRAQWSLHSAEKYERQCLEKAQRWQKEKAERASFVKALEHVLDRLAPGVLV